MPHRAIPQLAATLQVAFYQSYSVPEYRDLSIEERRERVAEDYISALKMTDVIFEKARHEKPPPEQERVITKYIKFLTMED